MTVFTKVIGLTGMFYTKEFQKKKKHKNKLRVVGEDTVIKQFLAGKAEVHVYFEEGDRTVEITPESDDEQIKKLLGKKFLSY